MAYSGTVHVVINRASRRGSATKLIDEITSTLGYLGAMIDDHRPRSADETKSLLRELAGQDGARIVVVGGDGSQHLAANALAGTTNTLGIIPAGTGNDAALGLGLPTDVRGACRAALADPASVDLIRCGDTYALSVATFGFGADVNERADRIRWPKGTMKYTAATFRELPSLTTTSMTITVDGEAHEVEANLAAIANTTTFGGGLKVAPDASPTDGLLDVVIMGPASRFTFATMLPLAFSGRHVHHKAVTQLRGREVTIEGTDLQVRADGEPFGALPATFTVAESALKIAGLRPR